ncbi:MAG: hypothetical protein ACK4MI_02220 [Brevundimonas sp.]|uniref:hypothetical protein n=1 Tax=Brevundimonas sp. TaxID=1871086 RepID=UPI0028D6DBFB|nr:hypothetical protein [uncultured Brevundimonas sp.]
MKSRLAAALAALLFTAFTISPVAAQQRDANDRPEVREGQTRAAASRQPARQRTPPAPTPEQILAAAQEQINLTTTACQVSEAKLLGKTATNTTIYEVACGAAPGYILETKTPPELTSCLVLAHSAATARSANPAAEVGPQCSIAANTDTQKFMRQYAADAGVPCAVDQTTIRGRSSDGGIVYEIGCSDGPGYWIKQNGTAWTKTPCIQVVAERGVCDFTTSAENAAFVKTLLAGSEASSCNVTEARLMGQNANGVFYEAKCDGADGVIARLNTENVVQQIYPCATAQQIGGGCKLTTAPAAAPTPNGGRP